MYQIIIMLLKKIMPNSGDIFLKVKKDKQLEILNKLSSSINKDNLIERSYCQYKCQMALQDNQIKLIVLNIISMPIIIVFSIFMLTKGCKFRKETKSNNVALNLAYKHSIPDDLYNEFQIVNGEKKFGLDYKDIEFFVKYIFIKYPFSYYFCLKNLVKISIYRYNINKYNPKAFIVNSEYAFTSSTLTLYCNLNNIEHINCMHGEKLFCIRDSFVKFNRFYIWDKYYKTLLTKLEASPEQFILYELNINNKELGNDIIDINNTVKYYLQNEDKDELLNIVSLLESMNDKGYKVIIRPHPRYTDIDYINSISKHVEIESNTVEIIQSIIESEFVISKFSTVLYQAYCLDKKIVIDDITNKRVYENLSEYEYIMLNKEHITMSRLIGC